MNQAWRWKFGAAALSVILGLWCILPNFTAVNNLPDWAKKLLPDTKLQLGLDLQGGIQMTLGVDLERALLNESERYVRDLEEFLKKEGISFDKVERDYTDTKIHVILADAADMDRFDKFVADRFNVLEIVSQDASKKEVVLNIPDVRQTEIKQQTIQQALQTLRNRLDEFGVAEPTIQAKGTDKIVIQLPGMADPTRAREILAQTAQLEFKMVDDRTLSSMELQHLVDEATKAAGPTANIDEINRRLKEKIPSGTEILFEQETDPTNNEVKKTPYLLIVGERISGDLLDDARIGSDEFNRPNVAVHFNMEGTRQFDELTKKNVGKRLAIVLDNQVKSAPVLQSHIPDGRATISLGSYLSRDKMMKEATDLALVLRAGALPAPIEVLGNQAVGPSLGKDSIEKGLNAMKWGALIIVIFMFIYYRMSGLVADVALVLNIIFVVACLGLLHATLTLPGLAGILISVGISADANVIIFERIREELISGKTVRTAIETAYERAHLTILDSNLTTVITGLVLFEFGTGSIKGFAITLIFGLISNYITALWFTKLFYDWYVQKFQPQRLSV